jgi:hypothetical protein
MSNYYRSLIESGSILLTNLVAYYAFENIANDLSGNSNNGTVIGSPTFTSGKNNLCIDFIADDITRHVQIADSDTLSFTNGGGVDVPFTISIWVNFSSLSSVGNWLINKRTTTTGGDEWQLLYTSGLFIFNKFDRNDNGIYQGLTYNLIPSSNTWYHLVYTDDGSKTFAGMKLYINGNLISGANGSLGTYTGMPNGTSAVILGNAAWNINPQYKHKGKLDETAIWKNRELSALEVSELYNSGVGKFYPFT